MGSISGITFNDGNADAVYDKPDSIGAQKGVKLVQNGKTVATTTSDLSGNYTFFNLPAGTYEVTRDFPAGFNMSNPTVPGGNSIIVVLTEGEQVTNINIGSKYANAVVNPLPSSISGITFGDGNADGVLDTGDTPQPRAVKLVQNGVTISTVTSDKNGYYIFPNLVAGTYHIMRDFPTGYNMSNPTFPGGDYILVELSAGQNAVNINVGSKYANVVVKPKSSSSSSTPEPSSSSSSSAAPLASSSSSTPKSSSSSAKPATVNYALKGIGSLSNLPVAQRDALAKELGAQGDRGWYNHSDRFTVLPQQSEFNKFQSGFDWLLGLNSNAIYCMTSAREIQHDSNGNITRTQSRVPKDADIRAWAKAYWNIWKRYGNRVIHNIGNEIDGSGSTYFQPESKPAGSKLSDVQWLLQSYITLIQKPFYETLKDLGGDDAIIGGPSIQWNPANFEMACNQFGYADYCDVGDIHRYAMSVSDWTGVFSRARNAIGSKKLMCSEWGASHYTPDWSQSRQATLITQGYASFAPILDYTFYYMLPGTAGRAQDPGLWLNNAKLQPLWDAVAKLPGRSF